MVRQILAAGALVLAAGLAQAQNAAPAPITSAPECFAAVDGLAQAWENHKYASKADSDKIGAALKQLEAACEGSKFADAQKMVAALQAQIH